MFQTTNQLMMVVRGYYAYEWLPSMMVVSGYE